MSAESAHDVPPSRRADAKAFGKYQLLATLGHGGMADVYLAATLGPGGFSKLQVIKRLRPSLAEELDIKTMFLDEARLAARLNHRNVVQTNEVGAVDGQYFIAMEYLDGQPLNRLLRHRKAPLPLGIVLRVLSDVLAGLHYAHELTDYDGTPLHVVHRDVSPQNVFVTYDGQVKVLDFGIAKAARRAIETQTGVVKGKLHYMAPEQAFASADVDRRADVFSVGVMLWEALAGRRLWHDLGDPEIIASLLHEIPSIRSAKPDVDPELARVCDKALARSPSDRHATAAELRADLDRLGLAASHEELGALLEQVFHEARAELRATIEKQVTALARGDAGDLLDLETSAPSSTSLPPEASTVKVQRSSRPSSSDIVSPTSSETPAPSIVSARRSLAPGPLQSALWSEPEPPRSRGPLLVGGILAVGALVGAYLLFGPDRDRTPAVSSAGTATAASATASASAAPAASGSAAASAAPNGAYIRVKIAVNPTDARITVDGAQVPSNPFDGRFLKDGAMHRVQIDAGGFLSQNKLVAFDGDIELDVTLIPRPRPAAVEPSGKLGPKPDPY